MMRHRFGDAFNNLPVALKGPGSRFMREFEGFKKDFSENSYETHSLNLVMPDLNHSTVEPSKYDVLYHDVKVTP